MPLSTKTRLVLFAVHFYFFLPLFRGHFNWWPSNWLATCPNTQTWPVASGQKFIVVVVVSNHSNWLFTATLLPCLCPCVPEFVCTLYSNSSTWSISLIALLIPYFLFSFSFSLAHTTKQLLQTLNDDEFSVKNSLQQKLERVYETMSGKTYEAL